jgi:hypothetical protein
MTFNDVINKIMPEVEDGSTEPFIIYRDSHGSWHSDHTQNQYGEIFDWVEDVKVQDPLAVICTGKEFAKASFPVVHDSILYDRIENEYYIARSSGRDSDRLHSITCFLDEALYAMPHEITDYLTTLERPLAALSEMCTVDLKQDSGNSPYNEALVDDAIKSIEDAVRERMNNTISKLKEEIKDSDAFTVLNKISINDSEIILSENPDAEYRYLVVENRYTSYYNESGDNNIFTGHTNDYLEAITVFAEKVQYNASCAQTERNFRKHSGGVDYVELKDSDCLPGSRDSDYTDKLIIVKAEELRPEYRTADFQLMLCTHGNGARPNAIGTSVFGKELFSGDSVCYGRHQIAGIADPEKLPAWAIKKMSLQETEQKAQRESDKSKQKPSLLGKLDKNKKKADINRIADNNKPNKRKRTEVTH